LTAHGGGDAPAECLVQKPNDACRLIPKRKNATQKAPSKKTTVISLANKKDGIEAVLSCIS